MRLFLASFLIGISLLLIAFKCDQLECKCERLENELKLLNEIQKASIKELRNQLRNDINSVSESNASFYRELDMTCRQIKLWLWDLNEQLNALSPAKSPGDSPGEPFVTPKLRKSK